MARVIFTAPGIMLVDLSHSRGDLPEFDEVGVLVRLIDSKIHEIETESKPALAPDEHLSEFEQSELLALNRMKNAFLGR